MALFTRTAPAPETWTPEGTLVSQRYRALEGAIVLVYTDDGTRGISYYAAACLGCTFRAARNRHRSVRLEEKEAADLANAHAADCRALDRGIPAPPDDLAAARIVRDRLWSLRKHIATNEHYVTLSDFHADRVELQRPADFIKQTMLQLAQSEPDFLTTEPYSSGTGTHFLVQPHPPRS